MFEGEVSKDLFKTPLPERRLSTASLLRSESRATPLMLPLPVFDATGARVWTKDEWRQLDACFTDQRLDIGATLPGADEETVAPVDMVRIEDVVDRFVALMGGVEVVEKWGGAWSRLVVSFFLDDIGAYLLCKFQGRSLGKSARFGEETAFRTWRASINTSYTILLLLVPSSFRFCHSCQLVIHYIWCPTVKYRSARLYSSPQSPHGPAPAQAIFSINVQAHPSAADSAVNAVL
jgi:hypothetical protein